VFLGEWTPESVGDYCSGTNHVLPTYGNARGYSGLGVEQFMRFMTVQELTVQGLNTLAPTVLELASLEGLDAHAEADAIGGTVHFDKDGNPVAVPAETTEESEKTQSGLSTGVEDLLLLDATQSYEKRLEYIQQLIDEDPQLVAEVLKGWIKL